MRNRYLLLCLPLSAGFMACSTGPAAVPRAIVAITIGLNATTAATCGFVPRTTVAIGCAGLQSGCEGTGDQYLPVAHGGFVAPSGSPAEAGEEVHVYCSITSLTSNFKVEVSALRVDPQDPSKNVQKFRLTATVDPTRTGQAVTLFASNSEVASFNNGPSGCTISFPESYMGIASGRIWGVVNCPDAQIPTDLNRKCALGGTIRFENCGE